MVTQSQLCPTHSLLSIWLNDYFCIPFLICRRDIKYIFPPSLQVSLLWYCLLKMSVEEAALITASELLQYAIINVNVFKLREWFDLVDCLVVCVFCNYQHSLQTGMSNFYSSQQADYNDGIMGWVKLTGSGGWNGCSSVMSKCDIHRARKINKREGKKDLFTMWAVDLNCSKKSWKHGALVGFPRVFLSICKHLSSVSKQQVREGCRKQQNWKYALVYARKKTFKQCG